MISRKVTVFFAALLIIGAALLFSLASAQPQGEKLVLYNNFAYYEQNAKVSGSPVSFDLPDGVERDSVKLKLASGYVLSQFVKEANYTNSYDLLKAYVGKDVSIFDDKGNEVKGTLLKFDGKAYVKATDGLYVITPNYYLLPGFSGNVSDANASVVFQLNSTASDARLTYLLDSISWSPDYTLYLNGGRGTLSLYGAIDNTAKDYDNVSLSLFYGQVRRVSRGYYYPAYDYAKGAVNAMETAGAAPSAPSYTPSAVSEFYKFDLGNVALPKGQSQYNLFEKGVNEIKKTYEMEVGGYSADPQPLAIMYSINNSAANGLGVALPAGTVRIMDDGGFVGEDSFSDVSKGGELKLDAGSAFDVVGTSMLVNQTDSRVVNCAPGVMSQSDAPVCGSYKGYYSVTTYVYSATVRNKKSASGDMVLNYRPYGDWVITDETLGHEKVSQNLVRWKFALGPDTEKTVAFTIKVKSSYSPPIYYGGATSGALPQ